MHALTHALLLYLIREKITFGFDFANFYKHIFAKTLMAKKLMEGNGQNSVYKDWCITEEISKTKKKEIINGGFEKSDKYFKCLICDRVYDSFISISYHFKTKKDVEHVEAFEKQGQGGKTGASKYECLFTQVEKDSTEKSDQSAMRRKISRNDKVKCNYCPSKIIFRYAEQHLKQCHPSKHAEGQKPLQIFRIFPFGRFKTPNFSI